MFTFLTKKSGMSDEDFRSYYENNHSKLLGKGKSAGLVLNYRRNYPIKWQTPPWVGESGELEKIYDCVTEVTLRDREALNALIGNIDEAGAKMVAADEENFVDRSKTKILVCEVEESDLASAKDAD